jgi:hypothetical protein
LSKFKYKGKTVTVKFVKGAGWSLRVLGAVSLLKAYDTYGAEGVISELYFGDPSLLPSSHDGPPGSVLTLSESGAIVLTPGAGSDRRKGGWDLTRRVEGSRVGQ